MGKIENYVTLLLLLVLPGQFIIQVLPFYGLSSISSVIVLFRLILSLLVLFHIISNSRSIVVAKESKRLLALYALYFAFIIIQVFVTPRIPRELMMDVPETNSDLFIKLFQQTILLVVFAIFSNKIHFDLFAKCSTCITLLCIIAYFNVVDFRTYGILDTMDWRESLNEDVNFIGVFMISRFIAFGFCSAITLYGKWCKNKTIDRLITYITSVALFIGLLLIVKRGPILSALLVLCVLVYYNYKSWSAGKKISFIVLLIFALVCLNFFISSISNTFENGLFYRFSTMFEGGSRRFGNDESVYSQAIEQIFSNPIFGSYFRLLSGPDIGAYPHNLILELMMTFGVFISAMYFVCLWKSMKKVVQSINYRECVLPIALAFVYMISALMFSSSLIFLTYFWIPWAILQGYTNNNIEYSNE